MAGSVAVAVAVPAMSICLSVFFLLKNVSNLFLTFCLPLGMFLLVLVLLSASVKRFGVPFMRDFFNPILYLFCD